MRFYEEVAEMDLADLLECDFCREREKKVRERRRRRRRRRERE